MKLYLTIFFLYSFAGWLLESVGGIFNKKVGKFVNRGFLIGPVCPVYGLGVVLIDFLLNDYTNDIWVLYFMSLLICGTLEYFTSYIMEKIFKARWWDYSNTRFNINGRICLETLIPFGVVGTLIVKFLNPNINELIQKLPQNLLTIILSILTILFIIDCFISFKLIFGFRKNVKIIQKEVKDNTDEIVRKVKEITDRRREERKQEFNKFKEKISLSLYQKKLHSRYRSAKLQKRIKDYREKISNEIENSKLIIAKLKEKYLKESKFTGRLLKAFPNLEIKFKKDK